MGDIQNRHLASVAASFLVLDYPDCQRGSALCVFCALGFEDHLQAKARGFCELASGHLAQLFHQSFEVGNEGGKGNGLILS
jgi:hypothetical protein